MPQITLKKSDIVKFADFLERHDKKTWFMAKDEGAYIGATAGTYGTDSFERFIRYFKDCDPTKQDREEVWDNARAKFGGDDFGIDFPADVVIRAAQRTDVHSLCVKITPTRATVDLNLKKPA